MRSVSGKPRMPTIMPRSIPAAMMMTTTMTMTLMMIMMVTANPTQARITCPPKDGDQQDPTLEEMYYYSDVVVMGKVIERHLPSGKKPPAAVYTAEMEVYCVYKGANVPAHINITDAGKPPHLCFQTNFDVGVIYMAYLKKHNNGRLTPTYPQSPETYKDEITIICDINITLPVGLKKLPEGVQCTPDYNYDYDDDSQNVTCFSFHPKDDKDQTYKTGQAQDDEDVTDDDNNGNEPLRMSLLLLALLHVAVLVFS